MARSRLVAFDLLRIFAMCLILVLHLMQFSNIPVFSFNLFNLFSVEMGNIGVLIFIVVSGAVLELNKRPITTCYEYLKFECHRLLRLYPAYWISLIFALILYTTHIVQIHSEYPILMNPLWQFSGFMAFTGYWGGSLNPNGWCIGLFVVLYILYPVISKAINRNPNFSMVLLIFISLVSTYYLNIWAAATNPFGYTGFISCGIVRWFPLCNLMYFGLGIFIVNKSLYPKITDSNGIISYFGELSFFVFLFQYWPLVLFTKSSVLLALVCTFGLAAIVMIIDNKLHQLLAILWARWNGKSCSLR